MLGIINQGHAPKGNPDPGAINPIIGLRESDITYLLGEEMAGFLRAAGHEIIVIQSDSLTEIVAAANDNEADYFISIHCNSAEDPAAEGVEVYTTLGQTAADPLATAIINQTKAAFPETKFREDWGDCDPDKEANYYVLRNTVCPAVLIECGFSSNRKEQTNMQDPVWRAKMTAAWARGVTDWQVAL
ncbi:N-acetylmuramoyl-L-alanine amidase LytC [Sporomusa rhizae]|uniref:N-acetylmuramoyl-L-alanine amidase family protein n=1 Tax=Sporomusa rhizae TaxID=357999 RepID=UPI00352A5F09